MRIYVVTSQSEALDMKSETKLLVFLEMAIKMFLLCYMIGLNITQSNSPPLPKQNTVLCPAASFIHKTVT